MIECITQTDFFLLNALTALRMPILNDIMAAVTRLGDGGTVWIAGALILCCFKKTRATGILMLCALAVTYLFSTLGLKNLFARPRPCVDFPEKAVLYCPHAYSFPSGHSISSFAAAGVLFFRHEKGAVFALILAFLIAFSRCWLYVHFPTDVLAGGLLGAACAWGVTKYAEKYAFFRR